MKLKTKIYLPFLFLFISSSSFGQYKNYNYQRELVGVSEQWHKLELPDEIFEKVSSDFSDIRIIGITKSKDTIEVPYIINPLTTEITEDEIKFNLINQTSNTKGYFYTLEIPSEQLVNQLRLEFDNQNFDWKVKLEGSTNQNEWFTILDNYRILSIHNYITNYSFTTLHFSGIKYRYLRLFIKSNKNPSLLSASITEKKIIQGTYHTYEPLSVKIHENKDSKSTEINIELPQAVPVSYVSIQVNYDYDYYREITLKYLTDSITTPKGQIYNYSTIGGGIINSFEKNKFSFHNIKSKKFRVIIENNDNEPLDIESIMLKGNAYELVGRFTKEAQYYLIYGNSSAYKPNYDIENFTGRIPNELPKLVLGKEVEIVKEIVPDTKALFENKAWLWFIMAFIVLLLGWFSVKMLKK